MSHEDSSRLRSIVLRLSELPPAERDGYLDEVCADDPEIRAEAERLIRFDSDSSASSTRRRGPALDRCEALAESLFRRGDAGHAAQCLAAARVARERYGPSSPPRVRQTIDRLIADVRETLGDSELKRRWQAGVDAPPEDFIRWSAP